jgi:hypothetical protein
MSSVALETELIIHTGARPVPAWPGTGKISQRLDSEREWDRDGGTGGIWPVPEADWID